MKFSHINISKIDPNPKNPRGIEIAKQDKKLPLLKDSIKIFGILVPIVVFEKNGRYMLIDGERRYLAAKSLGIKKVPAYINEKEISNKEILYQMFHIHHNREQWGPIQQCRALEIPYSKIKDRSNILKIKNDEAKLKATAEELSNETGIEPRTALTRIYFLKWPEDIKDKLYETPIEGYWYICEIEEKIIIPTLRNYPEYYKEVPVDKVRRDLFKKVESHTIKRATDPRDLTILSRSNMTKLSDRKRVLKIFRELHNNTFMTYSEAKEEFLRQFPDFLETPITPRKLANEIKKLSHNIQNINIEKMSDYKGRSRISNKELTNIVQELLALLKEFVENLKEYK